MKKVTIVGADGYVGIELAKLLLKHPHVKLSAVFSRNLNWRLADDLPEINADTVPNYSVDELFTLANQFEVIFLATPNEVSLDLIPKLVKHNVKIIDMSGAFRLSDKFQYGLSPWWIKQQKKQKQEVQFIANPGCYATCALMTLLPLLKAQIIDPNDIIIDAKSGVSGAGRKAVKELLFCEVADNFYPYKIGQHQHIPEIIKYLDYFADVSVKPTMVTYLLPLKRGISMTVYAQVYGAEPEINAAYAAAYNDYPLVKFADVAKQPILVSLKHVVGSAKVHISYKVQDDKVMIFSCLDNLLKGAASQAVENLNILMNLPITTSLEGTL